MAVLTKRKGPSGHWYAADGTPTHRIGKANGDGDRATTIRDARRLGLFPSVTSILGIMGKPGLDKWKQTQVALAALRIPKDGGESEDYWARRVIDGAFEQVEAAADLGSRIHDALENATIGSPYDKDLEVYVAPVLAWKEETGIEIVDREARVVNHDHGFAGTADVLFRYGNAGIGILDYKTRKTKAGEKVRAYDNQALQLAAYAATYWGEDKIPQVLGANVFISTTEPGRVEIVKHEELEKDWEAFKLIAALWRYQKGYDPRKGGTA